ncbi:uncharacterized protein DSM5745_04388 [Aspergillus mulundensis]|uniref:Uncharacterized protein n=1 Tax=Aspergillus mulundensis TaxID=1810919 RepID=A0A3D8SCI9_9EURO|nr:hypothetical protein DSM5745_04388 [Aspergillus mulundensis]RDW84062.1 hypothetical protein DSM5745_04388 [Aspergillus mulundensis]
MADPLSTASEVIAVLELSGRVSARLNRITRESGNGSLSLHPDEKQELQAMLMTFMANMRAFVATFENDTSGVPRDVMASFEEQLYTAKKLLERLVERLGTVSTSDLFSRGIKGGIGGGRLYLVQREIRDAFARIQGIALRLEELRSAVLVQINASQNREQVAVSAEDAAKLAAPAPPKLPEKEPPPSGPELTSNVDFPPVEHYMKGLTSREKLYFSRLVFENGRNYSLTLKHPTDTSLSPSDAQDISSLAAIQRWCEESTTPATTEDVSFRLFICGKAKAPGGISLPQKVFAAIMERLNLPRSFFQLLLSGTSKLVKEDSLTGSKTSGNTEYLSLHHPLIYSGFAFRTPLSRTEDWTLALHCDTSSHIINGLVHGLQGDERSALLSYVSDAAKDACHPMLLPIILCEMLATADANGIRANGFELAKVEFRTNFSGFYQINTAMDGSGNTPEKEFAEMTRMLNYIISRLAFHEMRMHANMALTRQIREHMSAIKAELDTLLKVPESNKDSTPNSGPWMQVVNGASRRLTQRVKHLEAEHEALLLEIACHQKIAQSQLQIVYNLIAQRDNKDNLKMAEISTRIANTTKNDSYAMRTLALMSVVFLPATFIASFFSMDMFDWQAPTGSSIVTPRLWIYWAITAPLTLLVAAIWLVLYRRHLGREDEFPFAARLGRSSSDTPSWFGAPGTTKAPSRPVESGQQSRKRAPHASLTSRLGALVGIKPDRGSKYEKEDELDIQETEIGTGIGTSSAPGAGLSSRGNGELKSFDRPRRVNTVIQGPRR